MSNPARMLIEFFDSEKENKGGFGLRELLLATDEVEERLGALEQAGSNTRPFARLPRVIRKKLKDCSDDSLSRVQMRTTGGGWKDIGLSASDRDLLELLSDRLQLEDFGEESTIEAIRALLHEVKNLVMADTSLDGELRLFIARTVLGIEKQLDDFTVTGDFILRDALLTLFGLLRVAEESSNEPTKWANVWDTWGKPITQGLIVSLPQVGLALGQIFQAIEQ